jgi:hypothetical protein
MFLSWNQFRNSQVSLLDPLQGSQDSTVIILTGCGLNVKRGCNSGPGRVKNFLFPTLSLPVLVTTQPPFQSVLGSLFLEGIEMGT